MKLQVAFEYIVIAMVFIAFIIPIWTYVSGMQVSAIEQLSTSYAKNTVDNIASTADLVYSQGPPAKVPLKIYVPNGVESVSVSGGMISIRLVVSSGHTDVFAMSTATLNGTIPTEEGTYYISMEAVGDYVQIGS
jgi:hypothetical protein